MNHRILICLGTLSLAACSAHESSHVAAQPKQASAGAGIEVPALPSQDEADAAAAQSIDDKNADAEFEKLKKEMSGG